MFDVPVFAELPVGARKNLKVAIDAKWMLAAVERDKMRRSEGYRAPVHIGHHEPGASPTRAGHFRLVRVGKTTYEGREVDAVFADLENVTPDAFASIQRGELPYRSVEILNAEDTEISSLALLSAEVPHFRFPCLAVSLRWNEAEVSSVAASAESLAPVLFRFEPKEPGMKDEDKKDAPPAKEEATPAVAAEAAPEKPAEGDTPAEKEDAAASEESEVAVEGVMSPVEMSAAVKATMEGVRRLLALLSPNDGTMQNPPGSLEPDDVKAAPIATSAEAPAPVVLAAEKTDQSLDLAALKGEIAALKANADKRERDEATAKLAAGAREALRSFNLSAEMDADIVAFAALGADHLTRYVESIKRVAVEDGPRNLAELEAITSTKDSDEVTAFRSQGPDALKFAREIAREHLALTQSGAALPPLDRFIAAHPKMTPFAGAARRSN